MIPKILPADKVTLVEEGYYQEVPADAKARDKAGNLRTREYHSPLRGHLRGMAAVFFALVPLS